MRHEICKNSIRELELELELDLLLSFNDILDHFSDEKSIHNRETRSVIGINSSLESKYERNFKWFLRGKIQ